MRPTRLAWAVAAAGGVLLLVGGCRETPGPKVSEGYALHGGKTVDAKTLEAGRETFLLMCSACHGPEGRGDGPAAATMRPPPRNLQQGLFKFSGTGAGNLPTDEALDETLRRGLHGTPMLPWDISPEKRRALIQYLKTFSSRWKEEEVPPPVEMSPDPWEGRQTQAVQKGEAVYHVVGAGHAGCGGCHPGYVPRERVAALYQEVNGVPLESFAEEPFRAQLRDTEYPVRYDDAGEPAQMHRVLPTDFLLQRTKRVHPVGLMVDGRPYTEAMQREDLYEVIAGGIGGAAMPTWKGALPEENLWALVYYVQSLIMKRGTPEALEQRMALIASETKPPAPDAGTER